MSQKNGNCSFTKGFSRNKYFYGKLLTVRDFEDEQTYFINKIRMGNKFNFGKGIICGLEVELREGKVYVSSGIAVDGCGNFIVVPSEESVDLTGTDQFGDKFYLMVRYVEKEAEPVYSPISSSPCEEECENSRINEIFSFYFAEDTPKEKPFKVITSREKNPENILNDLKNRYFVQNLRSCPEFTDRGVVLAVLKKEESSVVLDPAETENVRKIIFNNVMLRDILISHISDNENPHGSLKTINNVGNKGDRKVKNIDLIPSEKKDIYIKPLKNKNKIEIGITEEFREEINEKIESKRCVRSINGLESERVFITSRDGSVEVHAEGEVIDLRVKGELPNLNMEKKKVLQSAVQEFDMMNVKFPKADKLHEISDKIIGSFLEMIEGEIYLEDKRFIEMLLEIFEIEKEFVLYLRRNYDNLRIDKDRIERFLNSVDAYKRALNSKEPLAVIEAKQDLIFYLSLLRPVVG